MPEIPEDKARLEIDADLMAAGWLVQDRDTIDLTAGRGIAVRGFTMKSGFGFADYLLYLDRKAVGAVEAKAEGTLTGVEAQSAKYAECIHQNHVFRARLILPKVQPKRISWSGNSYGQRWFMREGTIQPRPDRAAGARMEGAAAARWRGAGGPVPRESGEAGMLGVIFKGARCEIHNPALLKQLIVNLLDKVDWLSLPVDVKGTNYAARHHGPGFSTTKNDEQLPLGQNDARPVSLPVSLESRSRCGDTLGEGTTSVSGGRGRIDFAAA